MASDITSERMSPDINEVTTSDVIEENMSSEIIIEKTSPDVLDESSVTINGGVSSDVTGDRESSSVTEREHSDIITEKQSSDIICDQYTTETVDEREARDSTERDKRDSTEISRNIPDNDDEIIMSDMFDSDNGKSLRLSLGQIGVEGAYQDVKLSRTDEDITCIFVLIFQPSITLKRIWIIDDLERKQWTLDNVLVADNSTKLVIYGVKLESDDGQTKLFQAVNCGSHTNHSFQTSKETWNIDLQSYFLFNSILSTGENSLCTTDELKINTSFNPPDNYKISPEEEFPKDRDVLMLLGKGNNEQLIQTKMATSGLRIPVTLQPRTSYKGLVIQMNKADDCDMNNYLCQQASKVFSTESVMTKGDVERLQEKAEDYMRSQPRIPEKHEVKIMFRNKPRWKMDKIMEQHNGLMEKYLKDRGGDPHCPINGNIKGLFFSVSLDLVTKNPPDFSFYGNRRLHVPVEALFTSECNLYFADFFCTRKPHYVTVVLTKKNSDSDIFCQETLPQLDVHNNPFLFKNEADGKFHTTCCLHVEVLYTEDVDITALQSQYGTDKVKFTDVTSKGKGESNPNGLPKRSHCSTCNL